MLKIKGKEYPVSKMEFYMHDEILNRLEFLKNSLKAKNNIDTLAIIITYAYNQVKEMEEFEKNKLSSPLELTDDKKTEVKPS